MTPNADDASPSGKTLARGAAWSSMGRLGSQGSQFVASIVLARLLAPEQFGLLATVAVFSQFALLFFELGMGSALVRAKKVTEKDLSTVFWLNAIGGLIFAGVLAAAGPVLAEAFNQPGLRTLAPIVALSFTVNLGVCHIALLQRRLRFRDIALAELSSAVVGYSVAIVAALAGLGVYSLALGPIVQQALNSAIVWAMVPWRPSSFISRSSVRTVWRFSSGLLGFNVVNYWGRNADNLLIAALASPAQLGLYNRSYNFMLLPVQQISQVLGRVMLPALSRLQDDHSSASSLYRKSVQSANLLAVPLLAGVAAVAPALVPFIWGSAWVGMVPMLVLLCLAGIPQCMSTSVGWIYQSQNRNGTHFAMGTLSSSIGVMMMAVGAVLGGAIGVAWAVLLREWLLAFPMMLVATRIIGLRASLVFRDNVAPVAVSAVMGVLVALVPFATGLDAGAPAVLALQVPLGVAIYAVGTFIFCRPLLRTLTGLVGRST